MSVVIYFLFVLLFLALSGVIVFFVNNRLYEKTRAQKQNTELTELADDKSEREEHFTMLVSNITPAWYWRVNHEYTDFFNATIKKMSIVQITDTPGLFEAQRRCSCLNAAVYNYYSNLKKRCLDGELVAMNDLEVLNMRYCFNEFGLKAYPELVSLVWPKYQRPQLLHPSMPPSRSV